MRNLNASAREGVAAGIIFYSASTRRLLLVRRSDFGDYAGFWCGVGGGLDAPETVKQCAVREAWEELGYAGNINLLPINKETEPGFTFYCFLGIVDAEFTPVLNEEHTAYEWVDVDAEDWPEPLHPGLLRSLEFIARSR